MRKKVVILDMDGVVVKTKRGISQYPNWLVLILLFFSHWAFIFFPANLSREYFKDKIVYIVSKRPRFCKWATILWFKIRRFPVQGVYCIGINGDKRNIAERIDPDEVVDDKKENFIGCRFIVKKEVDP